MSIQYSSSEEARAALEDAGIAIDAKPVRAAYLALFALAFQLAVSFGHVHLDRVALSLESSRSDRT